MKAHLGQEQNLEQELLLPVLPSMARKGLVWRACFALQFTSSNC